MRGMYCRGGFGMSDVSKTTQTCAMCRCADFDGGDDGTSGALCWLGGKANVMPPTRCQHFSLDSCFEVDADAQSSIQTTTQTHQDTLRLILNSDTRPCLYAHEVAALTAAIAALDALTEIARIGVDMRSDFSRSAKQSEIARKALNYAR